MVFLHASALTLHPPRRDRAGITLKGALRDSNWFTGYSGIILQSLMKRWLTEENAVAASCAFSVPEMPRPCAVVGYGRF